MVNKVEFRSICQKDMAFLEKLYASTRAEEMAIVPWSVEEKATFIAMQFQAQHDFYQEQFSDAEFSVVLKGKKKIGRLYLHRRHDEHRIIDIALLPSFRGQGIGKKILQDILDDADAVNKKVRIHVEHQNPALYLYQKLGFKEIEDQGVYKLMEWENKVVS